MWIENNYRRSFLDMHIDDSKEEYLSKLDPQHIIEVLKEAGMQMMVVKCRPHTGLALFPTKFGRMHRGLKGKDYVGEMIALCRKNDMAVQAYFSQIFDNWAYENHPEWRMVDGNGKNSMDSSDYDRTSLFYKGRYGLVCPNNPEYQEYAKNCLTELTENYAFDSIFMDMPFWPEVCYCPSCKKKYYEATGKEMPRIVDWNSQEFREWQYLRERWLGEFTKFTSECVKAVREEVTIEQNLSLMVSSWVFASTELVADVCDYAGGDLYGGYLQQSFISKYYRNISKNLPFEFITSRCDPSLTYHTTTKSKEELMLYTITALFHNGALSICDGMNPDGTIADAVYKGVIKEVFAESIKYTEYVGGEMITDVGIWYPTHSKCSWSENGKQVVDSEYCDKYIDTKLNMAKILRQEHLLFDVIPSKKISNSKNKVLVICDVANIRDDEMEDIEKYLINGGNLYISGHIGHARLYELLEAKSAGMTQQNVTYMKPTDKGKELFSGFDSTSPLNIQTSMERLEFSGENDVLATITLPYTETGTSKFSSIHSNPPGVNTTDPAVVIKYVGKGKIIWTSAPIENENPIMSQWLVGRLLHSLINTQAADTNAPSCVEVLKWKKDNRIYLAVLNEQEHSPFVPMYDIQVTIPEKIDKAIHLNTGDELALDTLDGKTKIRIPKLEVFHLIELV